MKVEIFPLEKIRIEDKEFMIGMDASQAENMMGKAERRFENYGSKSYRSFYFNSELGLDFDENGLLEFIEFLGGNEGMLKPYIYGLSVFETDAEFCYCFLNESIGLWREDSKSRYWDTIGVGIKDYYRF
ncbi:hypothetical protein HMPREF0380_00816 [Eubacterium infirmum F0142]|nr:hypothetical protein HMPREF0380_00816 [Eubacterium infirmum F0142]